MFDNYCSSLASGVCQRARWPLVHCRWLYKRLLPAVQEAGCGSLAQLLQENNSEEAAGLLLLLLQQAKEAPGGVPASPSTQEQCSTLAQPLALDSYPLLPSPCTWPLSTASTAARWPPSYSISARVGSCGRR